MKTMIIAHRGESFDAPENTLSAVNLAWERGAEAVEVDIRLSKDNKIVVIHDKTTKRIGNKNEKVKYQTLEELRKLDFGSWKSDKFIGEKIPTLFEIFETVPKNKKIIIEVKSSEKIIPFLIKDIQNSNLLNSQIEIISFKYDLLSKIKKELPDIKMLYLVNLDYSWMTKVFSLSDKEIIKKVKLANLDGINAFAGKLLTEKFIYNVKWENLLLYTWTVNDLEHAQKLVEWNVDAITTDRAQWLSEKLNNIEIEPNISSN